MYRAYYALIQFSPDDARGEAANVGVVFTCPERNISRVMLGENIFSRRLLKNSFFSEAAFARLRDGFASRLKTILSENPGKETLSAFRPSGANPIRLSLVREMAVADPADVDWMLGKLVGDKTRRTPRGRSVNTELKSALVSRGLQEKLRRDVTVYVPALKSELTAPFAYKNGRLNLIEPANFATASLDRTMEVASRLAVSGRSINLSSKSGSDEKHLIVMGRMNAERSEDETLVSELLNSYGVDFYPMRDEGFDALAQKIRLEAH